MAEIKKSTKGWVIGIVIVVLVAVGAYVFMRSSANADVMPPILQAKSVSNTVLSAIVAGDYSSKDPYISAIVQEGVPADVGKTIYVSPKSSGTTFVTAPNGTNTDYQYGVFSSSTTLKKGDQIIVSGSKLVGYNTRTWITADAITLNTRRALPMATPDVQAQSRSEGFKMAVRGTVVAVTDYYNVTVSVTDGNIGFSSINLSPIWGLSNVSGLKVGDKILVGLNYARIFTPGGNGPEASIYTADVITTINTTKASPTPVRTVIGSPIVVSPTPVGTVVGSPIVVSPTPVRTVNGSPVTAPSQVPSPARTVTPLQ